MEKKARKKALLTSLSFITIIITLAVIIGCTFKIESNDALITHIVFSLLVSFLIGIGIYILVYLSSLTTLELKESIKLVKNNLDTEKHTEVSLITINYYGSFFAKLFDLYTTKFTAIRDSKDDNLVLVFVEITSADGNVVYNGIFQKVPNENFTSYYKLKEK